MTIRRITFGSPVDGGEYERRIKKAYALLEDLLRDPRYNFANAFLSDLKRYYKENESFSQKQIDALTNIQESICD